MISHTPMSALPGQLRKAAAVGAIRLFVTRYARWDVLVAYECDAARGRCAGDHRLRRGARRPGATQPQRYGDRDPSPT